ncbi:uncharacterized protein J3D65DRAFT_617036 [Phyllosticta citribraziliensis]|uniref:Secreted protein n=1 Tax=Phyllosticta citribraziliensis TaxID=989973 RepID=A0ABR1M281_9PEZI
MERLMFSGLRIFCFIFLSRCWFGGCWGKGTDWLTGWPYLFSCTKPRLCFRNDGKEWLICRGFWNFFLSTLVWWVLGDGAGWRAGGTCSSAADLVCALEAMEYMHQIFVCLSNDSMWLGAELSGGLLTLSCGKVKELHE